MNAMQRHLKNVNSLYSVGTHITDGKIVGEIYGHYGNEKYMVETADGKHFMIPVKDAKAVRPGRFA